MVAWSYPGRAGVATSPETFPDIPGLRQQIGQTMSGVLAKARLMGCTTDDGTEEGMPGGKEGGGEGKHGTASEDGMSGAKETPTSKEAGTTKEGSGSSSQVSPLTSPDSTNTPSANSSPPPATQPMLDLIAQATHPHHLAQMDPNWAPWL